MPERQGRPTVGTANREHRQVLRVRSSAGEAGTGWAGRAPLLLALAVLLAVMSVAEAAPRHRKAKATRSDKASRFDGWVSVEPRRWPAVPGKDMAAGFPPLPPPRPAELGSAPAPAAQPREVCAERLAAQGIVAQPGEVKDATAACTVDEPVHLKSVGGVTIAGEPLVACAMAETFGLFVRDVAAPLTKGATGSALKSIAVGGGFECRPRNHVAGAKPSAHGCGLAIDVMGFTLADGRRISVESSADAPLVRGLRMAACGAFTTVLGPGADAAHATHLHLDLEKHGSSDRYRICQ